jgi:autotransporter-associated beta strand protein
MNMKNVSALICAIAMILTPVAQAATNTWDSTAGGAINDGAGAWLDAGQWNNGSPSATWSSGDDAIFGVRGTGGAVTLASPTTANSLTFNPFSGTYSLGTSGQALTLTNGMTLNSGAGAVTLISPITLGAAQSWLNNSASLLTVGTDTVSKAGYLLTVGGSGNTTVSGIIDGAGGLAKSGAGTLTLNGTNANTFTGGLGITNGTVILDFVSRGANANLVATGNDLTLASGTLQLTGNSANNSAQTLGNVTLTPGGAQILINPNGAARTATLTLGTIATNTAGSTLLIGKVSGASGTTVITTTTDKDATGIYGGRVVAFNGTANTGYDFATSSGAGPYTLANYAGYTTLPTAATSDTLNDQMTGNTTLAGAQTHNTLKIGSGLTLANGGFDTVLTAGGLLSVGSVASTISGTGTLTADNGSGAYELIIHQYNSAGLTISSVITNNGANAVTLVKSGSSTLILSGANNFSGGTVINAGTVAVKDNANLGATGIGITVNGPAALSCGNYPSTGGLTVNLGTRPITINNGAIAGLYHNWADTTITIDGAVTGNGGIIWGRDPVLGYIGGSGSVRLNLNSTGNTFTGPLTVGTGDDNAQGYGSAFSFSSLGDSTNPITFNFQFTVACNFNAAGPISNLSLPNRPINLLTSSATINNQNATYTMTLGAVSTRTAGAKTLQLVNGGAGGTIAGAITDGNGQIAVAKSGGGTWVFSGANTYSGGTTLSGGTLGISNNLALGSGTLTFSAASTLQATAPTLTVTNAVTINSAISGTMDTLANALTWNGVIGGAGNLVKAGTGTLTLANTNTFTGTTTVNAGTLALPNNLALQNSALVTTGAGRLTLGAGVTTPTLGGLSGSGNLSAIITNGYDSVTALTLNPASGISVTYSGIISNGVAGMTLTKTGAGTQILSGANAYTGATIINAGILSLSTLANGGVASTLGQSANSADKLVINGGTLMYSGSAATSTDRGFTIGSSGASLDASGTGTGTLVWNGAPAYDVADVARSLTLTGTQTGTNTFAAVIANNGAGAVSVTKAGVGTWLLTGNNLYAGATTLTAGKLMISAANNLGSGGNLVFNGGTLSITNTTLNSFSSLGHPVVCNPGVSVGLDIASAGNTFTVDQAISGSVSVVKSGPGTLVFSTNNTYTGSTTISAGVLQYNDGSTIPTTPLLNNGALVVNRTDTLTQGSTFHSIMGGTGSLTNIGSGTLALNNINTYSGITKANAGTIALSHAQALWNSAIDTTGAGAFTLSGAATNALTIGGLSGASGDLASVITTGYSSVTNLILNPSGTVTYGGAIADGASGMALTMAGSGAQVLTNSNTYAGATILKAGTLQLSGNGSITNSALNLSGGGLLLSYADSDAEKTLNRVSDTALVTAIGGGTITYTTAGSTRNFAETLGTNVLTSGQLNLVESANMSAGSQTLTLGGLTQTDRAAVTFSATTTGPQASGNRNMIVVTGAGSTTAGQIIGPWATVGTAANAQTDYAVYSGNYVIPAAIAATTQGSWTTPGNAYTVNTTETLSTTRTIAALRNTLAAGSVTLATGANLETYGILNGAAALTVAPGTGGVLTTPSGGGNLFLTAGAGSMTVSAPINNSSDSQPVSVVKSGGGALTLSSTTSTFSGGIVLNAGTFFWDADSNLGNAANGITVNGNVTLRPKSSSGGSYSMAATHAITINDGAVATIYHDGGAGGDRTVQGVLSGNGTLICAGGAGLLFSNTGNTFTGPLTINYNGITIASLGDSSNPIDLAAQYFAWTGSTKNFASRPFSLSAAGGSSINNNGSGALIIQQNLGFSGAAGARTLNLGGSYAATANTFAGRINDGPGSVVTLTKAGSTWSLSGTNTYSGTTTIAFNGGTLIFQGIQALSPVTPSLNSTTFFSGGAGVNGTYKILDDSATPASRSGVNLNFTVGENAADAGRFYMNLFVGNNNTANGGTSASTQSGSTIPVGNFNINQASGQTTGGGLAVTGANGYKLQINNIYISLANTFSAAWPAQLNPTTAPLIVAGNVQQTAGSGGTTTLQLDGTATNNLISGNILDSADVAPKALTLTKQNTSEWILSGTNTYTGITKISGGTLQAVPGIGLPSTSYLQLDGGVLQASGNFTRVNSTTVNGANMQWLSANGGFSARGGKLTVAINNSASTEQVWGTAVGNNVIWGTLKFGSATANSEVEFQNNIDLAGTTRTVDVASGTGGDFATLSGVIRTASGTVGLTKTGTGTLLLSGANTYNGVTTISAGGGTLAVSSIANVASPNPLGQSSAAAANLLLGNNTTLKYTGPTASTDRSFTINGTAAGHQAALDASGTGAITFATTNSPAYNTGNQTRLLILTGSNTDNNTLAANLPNNGTGALSIQKSGTGTWVISGSNTYSGTTTVDLGTLRLGGRNALSANTTVVVGAGTLDMAGYTNTVGTLNVTGAGTINLGAGGKLAFANSSANAWSGGSLRITGNFVSGSSIRFGNSSGGLTAAQLAALSSPGISSFVIDANGYLVAIRPTIILFR